MKFERSEEVDLRTIEQHHISTDSVLQHFHDIAYKAISRDELLHAINEFLDESIVLPPGDWDQKTLLPIMDMARKKARAMRRKRHKEEEKIGQSTAIHSIIIHCKCRIFSKSKVYLSDLKLRYEFLARLNICDC